MTTDNRIEDVNVRSVEVLITPAALKTEMPISDNARQTVLTGRQTIRNILDGNFSLLNTADTAIIESRLSMSPFFKVFSTQGIPDIRVVVYNGVPVMAMIRVPTKKSEGKANLAQGGIAIGIDIATGVIKRGSYKTPVCTTIG